MVPIALCSLAALAVIIERLITFSTLAFPDETTLGRITELARQKKSDEAQTLIREKGEAFADLLLAAVSPEDQEQRESAAGYAGDAVLFALGRRLDFLAMIGTTTPLMGLLGTVLGMIHVFAKVAGAGNAADIALLADGIWQALITTAAGLAAAVPALIAHGYFTRKTNKIAFWMQHTAAALMKEPRKSRPSLVNVHEKREPSAARG